MNDTRHATGSQRRRFGVILGDPERARLRAHVERDGLVPVARTLRIGREPCARAVAGLEIAAGTEKIIVAGGLDALDAAAAARQAG
jgi:hypothetical protein